MLDPFEQKWSFIRDSALFLDQSVLTISHGHIVTQMCILGHPVPCASLPYGADQLVMKEQPAVSRYRAKLDRSIALRSLACPPDYQD